MSQMLFQTFYINWILEHLLILPNFYKSLQYYTHVTTCRAPDRPDHAPYRMNRGRMWKHYEMSARRRRMWTNMYRWRKIRTIKR
jgi:hypothetical protein